MDENTKVNLKYGQLADMVNRIEQIPPLTGTGAPTTSTPAWYVGQRYIDTQNNNEYYCVELPSSGVVGYVWLPVDTSTAYTAGTGLSLNGTEFSADTTVLATQTDLAGKQDALTAGTGISIANNVISATSTGPTVVQTTGTSTTDVMSQNAVTSMVFADPQSKNRIQICPYAQAGNYGLAMGNSSKATGEFSIAIGGYNTASGNGSIAFGRGASATQRGQVDFGTSEVSYGYNRTNYKLITGLYDPQNDHDAANKGYVDTAIAAAGGAEEISAADWSALWQ